MFRFRHSKHKGHEGREGHEAQSKFFVPIVNFVSFVIRAGWDELIVSRDEVDGDWRKDEPEADREQDAAHCKPHRIESDWLQ